MNEEIEQELKLSKKQNKNDRYNYLCSQFNGIEYAMKLEKYTNKLQQENTQLKQDIEKLAHNMIVQDIYNAKIVQQLKDKDEKISKIEKYCKDNIYEFYDEEYGEVTESVIDGLKILEILESNKED